MHTPLPKSFFHVPLSDATDPNKNITRDTAQKIFDFFSTSNLFRWGDANNDCEDRANAICMLLDEWNIPNYKGWVFSGYFLNKGTGTLNNAWNYHVAVLLPVGENNQTNYYIVDPATSDHLVSLDEWAALVSETSENYHFIKLGGYYIFPSGNIDKDNWHKRDKRNYRWTMQGLSGINGVSAIGRAQLAFCKYRVKKTEMEFKRLLNTPPEL